MQAIIKIVKDLSRIRKGIPQLIFYSAIHPGSFLEVRKQVMEYKKKSPGTDEMDVVVQSGGGMPDDAYRIIRTLRNNFKTVNIIVPFWAKSAATLMALGGSKIIMDEAGELGPLDVQLGKAREDGPEYDRESALNDEHSLKRIEQRFKEMYEAMYIRLYEHKKINIPKIELSRQLLDYLAKLYEPLMKQIDPYKLGDKRRKLDIGYQYGMRILAQYHKSIDQHNARLVVDYLVNGCPDHGFVIDYELISNLLNIVKSSKEYGDEYQEKLAELSLYLIMDGPDDEVVKFIHGIDVETKIEEKGKKMPSRKSGIKIEKLSETPKFAQNGKENKQNSLIKSSPKAELGAS